VGGFRQTLLTGNLMANAALKLAAFDLTKWLDVEVGAYGTDDPDRNALVPVALERVERLRGERYDPSDVWVVGDTANDLACARAGGARCLLVGTGRAGPAAVQHLGADAVLADLGDTEEVVRVLKSR
ncbi:MAG: HAD hydrolase-like protein, partial [Acidimicrobiales bacterium]